jgi:hypothetical protein
LTVAGVFSHGKEVTTLNQDLPHVGMGIERVCTRLTSIFS